MIKPTEGTFNPRANVSKLLKWGSTISTPVESSRPVAEHLTMTMLA